jgi:membrane protease YdiL (CAAX protease family)
MSIISQAQSASPVVMLALLLLGLPALWLAWRLPVTSDERTRALPAPGPLLAIALLAMVTWLIVPSAVAGFMVSPTRTPDASTIPPPPPAAVAPVAPAAVEPSAATSATTSATTAPTTAPSIFARLSPRQIATLSLLVPALPLALLLLAGLQTRPTLLSQIGLGLDRFPRGLAAGLLALLAVLPLVMLASQLTVLLWQALSLTHDTAHPLLQVFSNDRTLLTRVLVVVAASLAAPVYEEVLFRGYLQTAVVASLRGRLDDRAASWVGIVLASLVFTLIHTWWMQPVIFVLSLSLGWVYERRGNLWTAIALHAGFNTASTLLFASSITGWGLVDFLGGQAAWVAQ